MIQFRSMIYNLGQLNEKREELIDHTVTDNLRSEPLDSIRSERLLTEL